MNSVKKTFGALIMLVLVCQLNAQTYSPVIKVSKGQELNYKVDMTMDMVQSVGGQEMKFNTTASSTLKNQITEVTPDGKTNMIVSSWDAKVTTKMVKDTTMTFQGKVGSSTKMTFDKHGNLLSKLKVDTAQTNGNLAGLDNNINSIVFCEFPENPIKVGDKWTKEHSDSIAAAPLGKIEMKIQSEYSFDGIETLDGKKFLKITVNSTLHVTGKGTMQGMDLTIDGSGVKKDDILVNPDNSVVNSDNSTTEMDMNIAVVGQQNMTIPMNQKVVSNIKLIK